MKYHIMKCEPLCVNYTFPHGCPTGKFKWKKRLFGFGRHPEMQRLS